MYIFPNTKCSICSSLNLQCQSLVSLYVTPIQLLLFQREQEPMMIMRIFKKKLSLFHLLVSKQLDFQGLFSYLRRSHGVSVRRA